MARSADLDPRNVDQDDFLRNNLSRDCFTADPSAELAAAGHLGFRRMLKIGMLACVESAEEGLKEELSHIRHRVEELDVDRKFSPKIYAVHTSVVEALETGNVHSVYDSLHDLMRLSDDEIFDSEFRAESILTDSWERPFMNNVRAQQIEGVEGNAGMLFPILKPDPSEYLDGFSTAMDLLQDADPDMRAEIDEYITRLKLFIGQGTFAFTSPTVFGAIYLKVPGQCNRIEYYLEHMVHETSHLVLNVLMAHDPLLTNPNDVDKAPIRSDPRPIFQILHATFVLSRVVRSFRRVVESRPELGFHKTLSEFEQQFAEGCQTIERAAKLTELGQQLVASMEPHDRAA